MPQPAVDAVATGDCARLVHLVPEAATDAERLAVGWCLERLGRPADALPVLEAMGSGPLAEYGRLVRARTLLAMERPYDVPSLLEGIELPGPTGTEVRLLRGRALVESERSLEARDGLRELLADSTVGDEARWWLAVGGQDRGDVAAATSTFERVWASSVRGPWSERAARRLVALEQAVPNLETARGRGLVRDRIKALQSAHRHGEALDLLLQLAKQEPPGRITLARAYFRARKYPEATATYAEALGPPASASGSPRDLFDYALGTSRTGDYDAAATIYARLTALHPGDKKADFASFKLGYLEYDRGDCAKAIPLFKAHVASRPDSSHTDEALWFSGRCKWKMDATEEASALWKQLITSRPSSKLVPAARYWRARAAGRRGDAAAEKTGLEAVITRHPTSGYAWFAATRLGRSFEPSPAAEPPAWPPAMLERRDVQRFEALQRAGFSAWAREELRGVVSAARAGGRSSALAAAWAFIRSGEYRLGRSLASPFCAKPWRGGDPVAQQACTPRPEASIVAVVTDRFAFDPLIPFGIMTAESALKPEVTSIAGARGLMQLMPKEAARVHAELYPSRPFESDDLYSAPYNASLGTAELGMKARDLSDTLTLTSLPAAIASYNAGIEAVRRWLAPHASPPEFDEFVEDIGYTETRRYVKRVLGYTMAYRWVYGDAGISPTER